MCFIPFSFSVIPKWQKDMQTIRDKKGSPAMLIISGSAKRSVDVLRWDSIFCGQYHILCKWAIFVFVYQLGFLWFNVVYAVSCYRSIKGFKTSSCKIAKLFAKHFKASRFDYKWQSYYLLLFLHTLSNITVTVSGL